MFEVISENLTGLGGPMGSERTWTNWRKFTESKKKAKSICEEDYGEKIEWIKEGRKLRSDDLSYVMYHIKPVKVE